MSDGNIAALNGVGEGAPVDIAELGTGGLVVTNPLAMINP
ncbi:NADH-ubiquinone oxidoreductase [gamma proteobacterium HTCC2207]|uniref:NADH-ubiquinone oxidoreductase n=1 Tax=gamma proteobacterium HTCC2207 TaxID=314287 RepID=Q1YQE8_9GAMM|nr:NADH-ubiquinone oxidoreductase [gamma proteobacterium HTCC2207]